MRFWKTLSSALLALVPAGALHAQVTVFQDSSPPNAPGEAPLSVPIGGGPVTLNLFYQGGSTASTSNPCLSGNGQETCGWDIHVGTSSPNLVLSNFVPDATPPSDVIGAINGNVLRLNGGDPINGELGVKRIGSVDVTATGLGFASVIGNLTVTTQLAGIGVPTGAQLAVGVTGDPDFDEDTIPDSTDNCISIQNTDQADGDGDVVGNVCDNCTTIANPRMPAGYTGANTWAVLTGGQRDDDHDGFGNRCDGDFPGTSAGNVGPADLAQFRASNGESRLGDTCGTLNTRPCAIFDLDENTTTANNIGPGDLARFRALQGSPAGPTCPTCPLTCEHGGAGDCQ